MELGTIGAAWRYPVKSMAATSRCGGFRPNLVIAPVAVSADFVENAWVGRTLAIGDEVRLRVSDPSPRCVVTPPPQPGIAGDIDILRTMPSLGAYATVERGGTIRRGDRVVFAAEG